MKSLGIWIYKKENKFNSKKEMNQLSLIPKISLDFIIKNCFKQKMIWKEIPVRIFHSLKMIQSL